MKNYPYLYGVLLLFFLFSAGTSFSAGNNFSPSQQIKILLPQSSVINSDEYTLGEIAQIEGENILMLDKLTEITIGRSPLPGRGDLPMEISESLSNSRIFSPSICAISPRLYSSLFITDV